MLLVSARPSSRTRCGLALSGNVRVRFLLDMAVNGLSLLQLKTILTVRNLTGCFYFLDHKDKISVALHTCGANIVQFRQPS